MTDHRLTIRPLTPHIGAEVAGIDLSRPLDDAQFVELHAALMRHMTLFFRDQSLTVEQHRAFGARFGELLVHPGSPNAVPGYPDVMVLTADEASTTVDGENWHTDVSCIAEPPLGSVLYLHEAPEVGGDTMFASMYAAYEALSGPMQRMLEGLTALHDGEHGYRKKYPNQPADKVYPQAVHPVVRTHPVTGRPALFVNRGFTTRIRELSKFESDALLEMLFRLVEVPLFQCRFRWQPGSVAFWDNRATQHRAVWDYFPARRSGHRVTIKGDAPFFAPRNAA